MFYGKGYSEMQLSEVCTKITDGTHKTPNYLDEGITFISAKNIIDGRLNFSEIKYISESEYQEMQKRCQTEQGDVLLAKSGSLGMTAIVETDEPLGLFESLAILKYDRALLNGVFLCRQMQSDVVQAQLMSNVKGVAVKHLHLNVIASTTVIVPPMGLQEEFCAFAEQSDKSKFIMFKSQFIEMFGDYRTNSKGWPIAEFKEFAKIDANMTTDFESYAEYPHIGIDSIEKDTGVISGYRTVKEDNVISGKYVFTQKHIIYSKIRPNLNKVALPEFEGLCSADAYPILPNDENCNRIYLAVLLRSEYFLTYILGFSARSNMPKVNRKQVEGFKTPLPPIALQEQFAEFYKQSDKSK